ncbi:MAG TPA: PilW family protein [Solimonas sp.]|nr:PilW family protein [Solimonas sp.]
MSRRADMPRTRALGFSLIELMIAMVLGLLLVAAAGSVFSSSARSYRQDERLAQLQDELHFTLAAIAQEVELAGFWAETLNPASIALDASLGEPGCSPAQSPLWAYADRRTAIRGVDNASAAAAAAAFPCIDPGEFSARSDIVAIKRVAGKPAAPGAQGALLRATPAAGLLLAGRVPRTPGPTERYWEYRPSIFYIRKHAVSAGDGIPTLCRKVLEGAVPRFASDCFATGIEDLQLEYGLDLDGDGATERFSSAPAPAEFGRVTQVRISVLGRAERPLAGYTNTKTYRLGNAIPRTPADGYFRRVASTTVAVRNPVSLRVLLGPAR